MKMSKMPTESPTKYAEEDKKLDPFLNKVILGDVLEEMKKIPSGIVDMHLQILHLIYEKIMEIMKIQNKMKIIFNGALNGLMK